MTLSKNIENVDKKLKKTEEKVQELEHESIAMQILHMAKEENKKSSVAYETVIKTLKYLLFCTLILWFATIGLFLWYETHYGTEVTSESAETDNGGNACIGDNCYNGDISYGESEKSH